MPRVLHFSASLLYVMSPCTQYADIIAYSALFQIRVNTIFLENISPLVIFIRPPEKLVIEVTCRGRYSGISWERTFSSATIDPSSLSNHDEIYTIGRTTEADFGFYEVFPLTSPPTFQELVPTSMLDFIVTTTGMGIMFQPAR